MDIAVNPQDVVTAGVPRRVVATYSSYADAQRAVDFLSDRKFPVERVDNEVADEALRLLSTMFDARGKIAPPSSGASQPA